MAFSGQSIPPCSGGERIHHPGFAFSLPSMPCLADLADGRACPDADDAGRRGSRNHDADVVFEGVALLFPSPGRSLFLLPSLPHFLAAHTIQKALQAIIGLRRAVSSCSLSRRRFALISSFLRRRSSLARARSLSRLRRLPCLPEKPDRQRRLLSRKATRFKIYNSFCLFHFLRAL